MRRRRRHLRAVAPGLDSPCGGPPASRDRPGRAQRPRAPLAAAADAGGRLHQPGAPPGRPHLLRLEPAPLPGSPPPGTPSAHHCAPTARSPPTCSATETTGPPILHRQRSPVTPCSPCWPGWTSNSSKRPKKTAIPSTGRSTGTTTRSSPGCQKEPDANPARQALRTHQRQDQDEKAQCQSLSVIRPLALRDACRIRAANYCPSPRPRRGMSGPTATMPAAAQWLQLVPRQTGACSELPLAQATRR
jgi:hypothetical protein